MLIHDGTPLSYETFVAQVCDLVGGTVHRYPTGAYDITLPGLPLEPSLLDNLYYAGLSVDTAAQVVRELLSRADLDYASYQGRWAA